MTPDLRHFGLEGEIIARRHALYTAAREATPERWTGVSRNWAKIEEVALNPEPAGEEAMGEAGRQLS